MGKAPVETSKRRSGAKKAKPVEVRRADHLQGLLAHCIAAKKIADDANEKFLSYMLAMTIEETRINLS